MRRRLQLIPWWIYLALAPICFVLVSLAHELARQWVGAVPAAEAGFPRVFLVNFLAVLRIALPLFFVLLAVFAVVPRQAPARPAVRVGRVAAGGASPDAGAAEPNAGVAGPKAANARTPSPPRFDVPSASVGVTYGLLRRMEWRRFEIVCAEYLRCLNYEVLETGFGPRDAVDLEVFLPGKNELVNVVKCTNVARPVDVGALRVFLETMKRREVAEGMVFSVCGFTSRAKRFAARHRIALVGGETLCGRIRHLEAEHQAALVSVATSGDYTTPRCPSCGVKLVLRRNPRARPGVREFWGCPNFPRCAVTMPLN